MCCKAQTRSGNAAQDAPREAFAPRTGQSEQRKVTQAETFSIASKLTVCRAYLQGQGAASPLRLFLFASFFFWASKRKMKTTKSRIFAKIHQQPQPKKSTQINLNK